MSVVCRLWLSEALSRRKAKAALARVGVGKNLHIAHRRRLWWLLAHNIDSDGYASRLGGSYSLLASCPAGNGEHYDVDDEIRRDLCRTFPEVALFQNVAGQESLFRLLRATANYTPTVGYCQGMNFLAAVLLIVFRTSDECAAFETFQHLRARLDLDGVLQPGFPKLPELTFCMDALVEAFLPRVHDVFVRDGVGSHFYATPWWISLFVTDLTPESGLCLLAWDLIWVQGWKAVHRIALSILWASEGRLLACEDFEERMHLLRRLGGRELAQGFEDLGGLVKAALTFKVTNRMLQDLEACVSDPSSLDVWRHNYRRRFTRSKEELSKMLAGVCL